MNLLSNDGHVIDSLRSLISFSKGTSYVEARYQARVTTEVTFVNGELERIRVAENRGCGIRVLVDGCWGFSSTNNLSLLKESLSDAISAARVLAQAKKNRVKGLAKSKMVTGTFQTSSNGNLSDIDIEQKVQVAKEGEKAARSDRAVKAASCGYRETLDHKAIVNSDGADVEIFDSKPEFSVVAIAKRGSQSATAHEGIGVTGGWNDLFKKSHLEYALTASERAAKLLDAKQVRGSKSTIILDPAMVGLLSHEAIGHTVEADFVLSGSVVKNKMGEQVASELVTLVDSGRSEIANNAGGTIIVDDEGVDAGRTAIIEKGILKSFLHNRESAMIFGIEPTGNARAFQYDDEPLIRMRNTFIEPGTDKLEDMIKDTKHGYVVKGAKNGQADANGEFMFGAEEVYLIENGEVKELMRGASISGNAFEVLRSVDLVGDEFHYDIGTGYCGKYQPAKVDGGGPYIRCIAVIGGLQ
ncbi:MAG: TldD/PmbA family protein [Thaumarchaeota archaeon]|nr:MAG: TldD/PmbA family protein [Nitrososphaerota archaeon]